MVGSEPRRDNLGVAPARESVPVNVFWSPARRAYERLDTGWDPALDRSSLLDSVMIDPRRLASALGVESGEGRASGSVDIQGPRVGCASESAAPEVRREPDVTVPRVDSAVGTGIPPANGPVEGSKNLEGFYSASSGESGRAWLNGENGDVLMDPVVEVFEGCPTTV